MPIDPLAKSIHTARGAATTPFAPKSATAATIGEVLPEERTVVQRIGAALGQAPRATVGVVGDVLDILRTGEFISAGIAEEVRRKERGEPEFGYLKSIARNMKERKGYSEFTGSTLADLGLQIFADPLTYTPPGAIIGTARFLRIAKGAKKLGELTDSIGEIRRVKESLGRLAITKYMMGKYHPNVPAADWMKFVGEIDGRAPRIGELANAEMNKLVPDTRRKIAILTLAETVPTEITEPGQAIRGLRGKYTSELRGRRAEIAKQLRQVRKAELGPEGRRLTAEAYRTRKKADIELAKRIKAGTKEFGKELQRAYRAESAGLWAKVMETVGTGVAPRLTPEGLDMLRRLDPDERQFFNWARTAIAEREKALIATELLTRKRAAGFLARSGMNYIPHLTMTKAQVAGRMRAMIEGIKTGDPLFKGMKAEPIETALKELESVQELMSDAGRQSMYEWNRSGAASWWKRIQKRQVKGTAEEIANANLYDIETDLARITGLATTQALRLEAGKDYVDKLVKYMLDQGVVLREDMTTDPKRMYQYLEATLGKKLARQRWREGFKPVAGVKALKGYVVPSSISDEIKETFTVLTNPRALEEFFQTFAHVQNTWKAHTLALFPSYTSRNAISNKWNNYLAGMGLKEMPHYNGAMKIVWAGKTTGRFGKGKVIGKYTQTDLYNLGRDLNIIGAGETAGELGRSVGTKTDPWVFLSLDPNKNVFVRKGYEFNRFIEDTDRMAHFMWRLSKGDTPEQAAMSVRKFLFDYRWGLTPFFKRFGRNFALPFVAWTRFNLPLQLEMLATQPRKFTGVRKIMGAVEDQLGGPTPNDIYMAEWLKNDTKVRMRFNGKTGDYEYFILDSWWPSSDIRLALDSSAAKDQLIGMVSPLLKVFPEILWNYNTYEKRAIKEYPGQKKKLVGVDLPAKLYHLLRNVRYLTEADNVLQTIDRQGWKVGVWRYFVGRTYPQNYERQKQWWVSYRRHQLSEAKRQRSYAEKKGEAGNVEALDKVIANIQAQIEEYK